jgi:GR25 family glycosyltransferase involved in LPS biosynthesis
MTSLPMIYVVSLARAANRRTRMIDRLSSEHLPHTIVEACDGSDPVVIERSCGATLDVDRRIVACLVSHLRALTEFTATEAKEAIVCEDDIRPVRGFAERFTALRENVADDVPLVALGYLVWNWTGFLWSGVDHTKENLTTIGADLWGTQMYLVRRAWALECLERFGRPVDQIDTKQVKTAELITRESRHRGGLAAFPPLALEDLTGSILNPEAGVANHPSGQARWDSSLYVP